MTQLTSTASGPHNGQPIFAAGEPLESAQAVMIMTHGRGGSAADILSLADHLDSTGFAFLAPQAAQHTWYPNRFIAPLEANEPHLSSALATVGNALQHAIDAGIAAEKVILLGFSQGACLSVEYAARNAQRYGGVAVLSGGLIGPEGMTFNHPGSLDGTPIFLGCSDVDFHIPATRVKESTQALQTMGADVTERLYPGMGHTINQDEIDAVNQMMAAVRN